MAAVYKFKGTEVAITSANTVGNNVLIRVTNGAAAAVLTIANTTATYANVTLVANEVIVVEKAVTDTLAGSGMKAVAVAYRN